jgi:hypothetical protein
VFVFLGLVEEATVSHAGLLNERIVAVCAAGLLAGPWVGLAVGVFVTWLAVEYHGLPLGSIATAMLGGGLAEGLLSRWRPKLAQQPLTGFCLTFGISSLRSGLLLVFGFQALAAKPTSIRSHSVTDATKRLMTEFAPRLLASAKSLAVALRMGDEAYIKKHARIIKGTKSHCFGPIRNLPKAVKRRLSDQRGLVLDAETAKVLDSYRIEVSESIFEKLPWKFEVKIIDGEPFYFLHPEEYDPDKGGAQLDS